MRNANVFRSTRCISVRGMGSSWKISLGQSVVFWRGNSLGFVCGGGCYILIGARGEQRLNAGLVLHDIAPRKVDE